MKLILALGLLFAPARASAQTPHPAARTAPSPDDAAALAAQLNDPVARAKLVAQLQLLAQVNKPPVATPVETMGADAYGYLKSHFESFAVEAGELRQAFADFPKSFGIIALRWQDPATRLEWRDVLTSLMLVLGTGLAGWWIASRVLLRLRHAIERMVFTTYPRRLLAALGRLGLLILPIGGFTAAAYGVIMGMDQTVVIGASLGMVEATVVFLLLLAAGRCVTAPDAANLRLIPSIGDRGARFLYSWGKRLSAVCVYTYFILNTIELLGLPHAAERALLKLTSLLMAVLLVCLILQNRRPVRDWIRKDRTARFHLRNISSFSSARYWFGGLWHILAIAFVVVTTFTWTFNLEGGPQYLLRAAGGTLLVYLAARTLVIAVDKLTDRGVDLSQSWARRLPNLQPRMNRYLPVLRATAHWTVLIGFVLTCLYVWGIDSYGWLHFSNPYLLRALSIALVMILSLFAWEAISITIEHILVSKPGSVSERSARIRTLLPLARNVCLIVIVTIAGMVVLGELGIDTRPLLAGASVIGVALGFGSQTLVKDVITGMFILFENIIAVGDVVDLGKTHSGVVESLSIRTLRIRDGNGAIHTVPFSDVSTIINMSRDYSVYVVDLVINYREDTDQVVGILRELGAEMQADPAFSDLILAPLDVWGVDGFTESGMNVKAALKTRPLQQWGVAREFNRRLKHRFDAAGLRPPMPRRELFGQAVSPEAAVAAN